MNYAQWADWDDVLQAEAGERGVEDDTAEYFGQS